MNNQLKKDRNTTRKWLNHWMLRYGFAIVTVAVATWLYHLLREPLGGQFTYILYNPAVIIVAVTAGFGPALVASLLSAACADYFFLQPSRYFKISNDADDLSLLLFLSVSLSVCLLAKALHQLREKTELKLHQANIYNRSLIEASLDPLVTISPDGKITDVNEGSIKVTGVSRDELIGTDFSNYFTEQEKAREGYRQVFAKGLVTDYPLTIRHRDGKLTDVLYNASVYKDVDGHVLGVFAAARDITESKRVMIEFAGTKNYLDNILQSSTKYSIIGMDLDHNILSWNEGARRNYGYTEEEILGRNSDMLHGPEDLKAGTTAKLLATALQTGLAEGEFERVRKDGSRFIASVVVTRRCDASNRPIGCLLMSHDITEKKQAEKQLHSTSQYARSLIDASLDPLVTISPEGKITDVNAATEAVTGRSRDELIGTVFADYFTEPGKAEAGYLQVLQAGSVRDYALEIRHPDGHKTPVLYNAVVYRDETGEVVGIFAAARDITERKRTEESLKQFNETLKQRVQEETEKNRQKEHLLIQQSRLAAMGEMIGNIAHQWRQPLNALTLVLGNIEDAASHQELTPEYLENQTRNGERLIQKMSSTIDDFRHFFRPQKQPEPFSAIAAIEEARSLASASFHNNNIELRLETREDVRIVGFANEFSQVLLNLLSNAKDAILSRHIQDGVVTIRLSSDESSATIQVTDNGGGISATAMEHIFEPYFSTKEMGTGIGLYMSKMIIETSMHGSILARNVDSGAEFSIICPQINATCLENNL